MKSRILWFTTYDEATKKLGTLPKPDMPADSLSVGSFTTPKGEPAYVIRLGSAFKDGHPLTLGVNDWFGYYPLDRTEADCIVSAYASDRY